MSKNLCENDSDCLPIETCVLDNIDNGCFFDPTKINLLPGNTNTLPQK